MTDKTATARKPLAGFLTYPGDQSHMVGEVKGPNMLGERVVAVAATYDGATRTTRVGFDYAKDGDGR